MKIAFTSTDGVNINEHFGKAETAFLWDVGPDEAKSTGTIGLEAGDGDQEDKITARADALVGCTILYTMQIGGPAAAKLVARRIYPMKTNASVPIADVVKKLQGVMRKNPPPWLRKAMGETGPIRELRFVEE